LNVENKKRHIVIFEKTLLFSLAIILLYSLDCGATSAVETVKQCSVASNYVIRSLGSDIGTVSAKMSGTTADNDLRADVDVHVSVLFFGFDLKSTETTSIRGGKVILYSKTIDTGRKHREIKGELDGEMLTVVIRDGKKVERKVFPITGYQATNMEYPEVELAPGETRRMKILDLENSEVVDREYRYISEEQAEIGGRAARIVVSDFTDKNSEGRRWTAIINGLPVVVRQAGKEKTGLFNPSYSVRQTSATVSP
jgi:hypothetical protein